MNEELVQRSLNYHGQQLTHFLQENPSFKSSSVDSRNVDYHLYHGRSKELRMEDRGRRMVLHRFISQNFAPLFSHANTKPLKPSSEKAAALDGECVALMPPLETFLDVSQEDRTRIFYDNVAPGDVLFCRIGGNVRFNV